MVSGEQNVIATNSIKFEWNAWRPCCSCLNTILLCSLLLLWYVYLLSVRCRVRGGKEKEGGRGGEGTV